MSERQRSLELLNQLHQFPTAVLIKVIGTNHPTFVANVVAAVRIEVALEIDLQCTTRETPNGRHVAVTLEPQMRDAEQVLAVYECLRKIEGVVMLL